MNNVSIIGRLGKDPDIKFTQSGKAVLNFSVAVRRRDGQDSDWFDVCCWEKTAEIVNQYCSKGSQLAVNGRLQIRKWTDRDGNERKSVEIVATDVTLIGGRESQEAPAQNRQPQNQPQRRQPPRQGSLDGVSDDDIPF